MAKYLEVPIRKDLLQQIEYRSSELPSKNPVELVEIYLWYALFHHDKTIQLERAYREPPPSDWEKLMTVLSVRPKKKIKKVKKKKRKLRNG